jgi:hypothetical protein
VSSVINPVGPQEPSVYWRRRAVVVVVLLVLLWAAWMLLRSALGGGGDEPSATPTGSPAATAVASPDPTASADPGASPAPSVQASPGAAPACTDAQVGVTASTVSASTAVGAGLELSMTVTNTSETPCTRDVGAGANELRVISGPALVWSSDFCNPSEDADVQVLEPGQPWTTTLTWPGTIVPEGCPSEQRQAQPGSYQVIGRNGTLESEPVVFTVT